MGKPAAFAAFVWVAATWPSSTTSACFASVIDGSRLGVILLPVLGVLNDLE